MLIQGCTLIVDSRVDMSCISGKEVWDKMHQELRCSSHRYCPFAWSKEAGAALEGVQWVQLNPWIFDTLYEWTHRF